MKVKRKPVFLREDCFDASEGQISVRITRHRHEVIATMVNGDDEIELPMKLKQLWELLRAEARRVHGQ